MMTTMVAFRDITDYEFEKIHKALEIDAEDGSKVAKVFRGGVLWSVGYFKVRQGWRTADLSYEIKRDIQACIDQDWQYLITWIAH